MIYWSLAVIFLLIVITTWSKQGLSSDQAKKRFKKDRWLHVLLYALEIWAIFCVFNFVTDQGLISYKESSSVKRFMDFFTIYQILLFVIFKLIDSLTIDAYINNKYIAESMLVLIEKRLPIKGYEDIERRLREVIDDTNATIPPQARRDAIELRNAIELFDSSEEVETRDQLTAYLSLFVLRTQRQIELMNFHWFNSLFLRAFK